MQKKILSLPTSRLYTIFPELSEMGIEESVDYLAKIANQNQAMKKECEDYYSAYSKMADKLEMRDKLLLILSPICIIESLFLLVWWIV